MFKKTIAASFILFTLSACGGGGVSYDYTEGTPSSESSADTTISNSSEMSLPYTSPGGTYYSSLQNANTSLNTGGDMVATEDTNARAAWSSGWTGKNVKIGIADDFNSNGHIDTHGDWVSIIV